MVGGIGGKLTDKAVKAFVAKGERGKKLSDGGGLYLLITLAGGASWRIKYRILAEKRKHIPSAPTPMFPWQQLVLS